MRRVGARGLQQTPRDIGVGIGIGIGLMLPSIPILIPLPMNGSTESRPTPCRHLESGDRQLATPSQVRRRRWSR